MITREMVLEKGVWQSEYLTDISCDESSEKQEFVSGVSKIWQVCE